MSTVVVSYKITPGAQKRITAQTGNRPDVNQRIEIELAGLHAELRARLLEYEPPFGPIEIKGPVLAGWKKTSIEQQGIPQENLLVYASDVLAAIEAAQGRWPEVKAQCAQNQAQANAEACREAEKYMSQAEAHWFTAPDIYLDAANGPEAAEAIQRAKAEGYRRKAARDEAAAKEAAEATAEATAKEAEQLAWVKQYGSERLQKGIEAGYDCTRLYFSERAAMEYHGFSIDRDDNAAWKKRVSPSLKALVELAAQKLRHPDAEVKIVWLTSPTDPEEEDFEPCEAVVVDDDHFSAWLVKVI